MSDQKAINDFFASEISKLHSKRWDDTITIGELKGKIYGLELEIKGLKAMGRLFILVLVGLALMARWIYSL